MDENERVEELLDVIKHGLSMVGKDYYNLKTTYEPTGIVRERVFCYEFYHKMRCIMEKNNIVDLSLNGEIDKTAHLNFAKEDRKNPDFVFHIPGIMKGNTMIVEVKGKAIGNYLEKCVDDFKTIKTFISKYEYKAGVFILYNHVELPESLIEKLKIESCKDSAFGEVSSKIYVICKKFSSKIYQQTLYDILQNN